MENLLLVANGTLALQIALGAIGVKGSSITTPYTFVATSGALKWNGITPIYADINPASYNIDPRGIESLVREDTSAIVPVHVFGNPCQVEEIEAIAGRNKLKVIYDAAHTFAIELAGRNVLSWGDASVLSFHATKVFHCAEGGAVVFKHKEDYERANKMINFGIDVATSLMPEIGINAKMSELHAAMGLCNLDVIDELIEKRLALTAYYNNQIGAHNHQQSWREEASQNGGYYPFTFETEYLCVEAFERLKKQNIFARRYFQHSLDNVDVYKGSGQCPVSRDISRRVLCLPLYAELAEKDIDRICHTIKKVLV